ncbi:hypothetical protein BDM02DRAFT_2700656 [Thelephora ganbajun]|uniref:Uncharacterized protein n=1 Tax=Thelephora ganbajun TaxID=370292 RepID=A0ACB6ZDL7_THEGA|nr:hypothetical protein BDM02DRAFT_2700656 [Thelephora ganbajun]
MASFPTSGDGENADVNADGAPSPATQHGLTSQEGQLLQGIAGLQMQLNVMSRRQDELMGLIDVLQEQQEAPVPGPLNNVRGCTAPLRGSISYEAPGLAPSVGGGGGRLSLSEQLHSAPPNHLQPSLPHPGHPDAQRIPPSQGRGQASVQPLFHHFDRNGQPLNPPPPPLQCPLHSLPHPVPVFSQLHDRMGQVVGLVRQGSFVLAKRTGAGPSVRQLPPETTQPLMYRPPMYPQMQSQAHLRIPPQVYPQMPPQMQMQIPRPVPMDWVAPQGPPPPYPGPGPAPGGPTSESNQAGPSTTRGRASRTSGTSAALDPNDGPGDDGIGSDARPISRREVTGRRPTRTNPARKARPKQLYESD